ncbi:purine-cytosine permease family protein [Actinotignum urinale]|uniref:purine-cytosine permease family protein n=1 Tax=Actinotignum urinale TaxID=190146 RepID=UPI0003B41140|nr:cytosine permease [Actinotignum urinale]MDY5160456.1 cytosine permease [Actinotignum urinale]
MSGYVEQQGIDAIPEEQRYGKSSGLFFVWAGTTTNIFTLTYGAMLIIVFQLSFFQAFAAILVGNLLAYPLLGLTSLQGPRTGTTSITISRASFGFAGAQVNAFLSWLMLIGFEAGGLILIYYAASGFLGGVGITTGKIAGIILILLLGAIQALLPFFGHRLLMAAQKYATGIFVVLFIALAFAIIPQTRVGASTAHFSIFSFISAVSLVMVSGGLSYAPSGANFSRYLPGASSSRGVFGWATLGGLLPYVLLQTLGAALATITVSGDVDVTNPLALPSVLPKAFVLPFYLLVVVGLMIQNSTNLYSSSLNLQTAGINARRWLIVLTDSLIAIIITIIAVQQEGFYDLLNIFLSSLSIWLAPWVAINLVDYALRRGSYRLSDFITTKGASATFNIGGCASLFIGMVAAYLFSNSGRVVGPITALLSPENTAFAPDLSVIAGALTAAILYIITNGKQIRTTQNA